MRLHWIFGGSGSGKSTYAYKEIIRLSTLNPEKRFIVIVPEQFTMQTQRDMVMMSRSGGIMNIDVVSFNRLAYRVLEDTPFLSKPILADEGKGMIIRRILREHEGEWKSFGKNVRKPGFVEEIKSTITEFIQYRIDADKIADMMSVSADDENLVRKLSDLKKVYEYYKEFLEERYISSEEILKILADHVPESELLKDSIICLDGFTGFTPVQYLLLRELMSVCSDMYITACIDNSTDHMSKPKLGELFYMSKEFIQKCNQSALERHCEIVDPVWTGMDNGVPWRFADNDELASVEKNIFRNKSRNRNSRADSNKNVRIYKAAGTEEEVDFCLWEIRKLIRDNGLRYRDIAIVTGNIEEYSRILSKEFERLNMPYFIDYNRSVIENPLIRMILLVIENAIYGYDRNSTIRLLRNGIVRDHMGFTQAEVDEIDNYVLARGVRGRSRWEKPWDGISEEAQAVREKFVSVFISTCKAISEGKTVDDRSKALYELLKNNDIEDVMYKMAEFYADVDPAREKEYTQIYRIVIGMMDQMSELMGDENIPLREYYDLLKTGFSEASVGVIPPRIDTIIVGDTKRTRLKDIRVLFFLGFNDGSVPMLVSEGGFLSDYDRLKLSGGGMNLAPTAKEKIFNDRFYIYLNMTKPSDMLILSYAEKNLAGDKLSPSIVFDEVKVLYNNELNIESNYKINNPEAILENDYGLDMWITGLRHYVENNGISKPSPEWIAVHNKLVYEYPELYYYAFFTGNESHIESATAKEIYGSDIFGSVSRFELYSGCAYAHFLKYGLHLQEREEFKLQPADLGTLFHRTIELFTVKMTKEKRDWQELDEQSISDIVDGIVDGECAGYGNGIMGSDAKNRYMIDRIKRISKKSIEVLVYHLKKGCFEPTDCEVGFEYRGRNAIKLEDGCKLNIVGRIDRLDTYKRGDNLYYKIIDYKSGEKDFKLIDLYNGTNIQLAVYLMAAGDMKSKDEDVKESIPAGVFYFHIDDPVASSLSDYEKEIRKEFRMSGIINGDDDIPALIDASLGESEEAADGKRESDVIKSAVNKSGEYRKNDNMLTGKQIHLIRCFVKDKMKQYADEMLAGNTSIKPLRKSAEKNACVYCPYGPVCRFDVRFAGNSYVKPQTKDNEEIWEEWWNRYYGVYEKPEKGD